MVVGMLDLADFARLAVKIYTTQEVGLAFPCYHLAFDFCLVHAGISGALLLCD
jgi:hypothetical protein